MSIGFYDENQGRSYPLQPPAPAAVAPYVCDLAVNYGPDINFDLMSDEVVLWSISRSGVDWLFDFRIRDNTGLRDQIVVSVGDGSEVFTTHHAMSAGGRSYIYLTIGDIDGLQEWLAPSVGEAPAVEDRCVVSPDSQAVTSISAASGQAQKSFRDDFTIVSPVNPATNWAAARGDYEYDPLALEGDVLSIPQPYVLFRPGVSATVRQLNGKILIGMSAGEGDGFDCCSSLSKDQTVKGTVRSLWGVLPDSGGGLDIVPGKGIELVAYPEEHKIKLIVRAPERSTRCQKPVKDPKPEDAPPIPDPPE